MFTSSQNNAEVILYNPYQQFLAQKVIFSDFIMLAITLIFI